MPDAKESKKQKTLIKKPAAKPAGAKVGPTPEEVLKAKKHTPTVSSKEKAKSSKVKKTPAAKAAKSTKKTAPAFNPPKSKRGKKYRAAKELVDTSRAYTLEEAIELISKTSFVKFDASVECHLPLNVDPKQADQLVRGMVVLPHGNGKSSRVAVITTPANAEEARKAGADLVGEEDILEDVKKGKVDFDILVATPDAMPKLAKYAKDLGPKGLMPNPKSGTVTNNLAKTVKELKGGRVEFRVDPSGIIHQVVGKLSFAPEQIAGNVQALLKAVLAAKPSGAKTPYIKRIWLTSSMGPSIHIDSKLLSELKG